MASLARVDAENPHKSLDFIVLRPGLIIDEVVAEGADEVDLQVAALDVMKKDFRKLLLLLGEGGEGVMQLGQGLFLRLIISVSQNFEILLEP